MFSACDEEPLEKLTCSLSELRARPDDFPWEIRIHPEMGRGCFATRDLKAGETLAYDPPLLYWEEDEPIDSLTSRRIIEACSGRVHNNVVNLLSAYASASPQLQTRLDDFAHIPTPAAANYISHMTKVWTRIAEQIWDQAPELHDSLRSRTNIVDLLTRSHLNAHNFYTGHVMLEIGSKFNHSCTPNCTYNKILPPSTIPTHSGRSSSPSSSSSSSSIATGSHDASAVMRIFTIKPVKMGEQLMSTYIGGTDMLKSTRERRAQLRSSKAFHCLCPRCTEPERLSPLHCPACHVGTCLRHDAAEWPWHCTSCGQRFWDAQVTARESQISRLVESVDGEMNAGRFPPLPIVRFLVRDALEDLGRGHYLAIRARSLLDECYAYREVTGVWGPEEIRGDLAGRVANAWVYVAFLMTVVWRISPVVATNLAILRLRALLGKESRLPLGVPLHRLQAILVKAEAFLRSFWGEEDEDAALFRLALDNEAKCLACGKRWEMLVVCGSCASAYYCSRACRVEHKEEHQRACALGREVATILNSKLAF